MAEVTTLCFEIGTLPGLSSVLLQDRLVACKITFDLRFKKSLGAGWLSELSTAALREEAG